MVLLSRVAASCRRIHWIEMAQRKKHACHNFLRSSQLNYGIQQELVFNGRTGRQENAMFENMKDLQSPGSTGNQAAESFHLPEVGNKMPSIHWSPEAVAAEEARFRMALPEWLTMPPTELEARESYAALLAGTKELPSPEYAFPKWGDFEWPTEAQPVPNLEAAGRWNLATMGRTTVDWSDFDRLAALSRSPGIAGLGVEEGIGSTIKMAANGGALMLSPAGTETAEAVAKAAETLKIAEL
jgi:hypothetical protein